MTQHILGIAIPTYRRAECFKRLINQIMFQAEGLSSCDRGSLLVKIYENPSDDTALKKKYFKKRALEDIPCYIFQNSHNIGGDRNILQAYKETSKDCVFTWVIGDDEQLREGALQVVLDTLKAAPDLGLLLVGDGQYKLHNNFSVVNYWHSYYEFAKYSVEVQPHLLIAHTLISSNIARSSLINFELMHDQLAVKNMRYNLSHSFAHMKGIVGGLSSFKTGEAPVVLLRTPVLDTTGREVMEKPISGDDLSRLYLFYYLWLVVEFGISFRRCIFYPGMDFLLPRPLQMLFKLPYYFGGAFKHRLKAVIFKLTTIY
jgi:hypothetical protein